MYLNVDGHVVILSRSLNPNFPEIAIIVPYRHQIETARDRSVHALHKKIATIISSGNKVPIHRLGHSGKIGIDTLTFYTNFWTELEVIDALRAEGFTVKQTYPTHPVL